LKQHKVFYEGKDVLQGFSEVLMNKEGIDEASKKQLERIHKGA